MGDNTVSAGESWRLDPPNHSLTPEETEFVDPCVNDHTVVTKNLESSSKKKKTAKEESCSVYH